MSNYEKIVPIKIAQYRGLKQKDISWFVEFIKSGCFYSVAEDYINDQDKYVRNHSLYINGKYRNIITYRNDKNGVMLKNLHKEISKYLVLNHRPSSHSFAYRKKKNILMCIKKHENNSYFFKTDIHAFFDSVSYDNTLRIIKKKKSLIQSKRKNIDNEELFICFCTLLAACFYNNKLPIGFVTSPVLSDIYLSSFDRNISRFTKCIYTRYADDIIVSTNSENYMNDFVEIKMEIEKQFKELGLQLNSKKTYSRALRQPGDAIHLLGLNLVKTENLTNRITVSKKYLVETCKSFCEIIDSAHSLDEAELKDRIIEINGKIAFIKQNSPDSFKKFTRMVFVKSGVDLGCNKTFSVKNLSAIIYKHRLT